MSREIPSILQSSTASGDDFNLRALLIEDEADHAEFIRRLIRRDNRFNIHLDTVSSMKDAVDRLASEHYDIVMSDLHLHDSGGVETLQKIRDAKPDIPLIVLTSKSDFETGTAALHSGADDFLVKGELSTVQLLRAITHTLERKRTQLELVDKSRRLSVANRELENFTRFVSHDLRSPIAVILMDLEAVLRREKDTLSEESAKYIQSTRDELRRLSQLISDLLVASTDKLDLDSFGIVELRDVANSVTARMESLFRDENRPKVTVEELPTVRGSAILLEQVFSNLITNSVKYRSDEPPHVKVSAARGTNPKDGTDCFLVRIEDNGRGVPPEIRDSIFELFDRGTEKAETSRVRGSGIGLAIVKRIMQLHGGFVGVEDSSLGGTAFVLHFPSLDDNGSAAVPTTCK